MKPDRVIAVRNKKTVFREGNRCIKVFNEGYAKSAVLREALNQARIEETGLHIPKLLEVTTYDGKWAIVSEYIKGKTLAQLMEENADKKEEYLTLLVDLQLEVHSKEAPFLDKLKDQMRRNLCETELDATTRYDLHARLEDMPKHTKICHGDFNPSNIIIRDDSTPYILDWSHAALGDTSADAAKTYLLFLLNNDTYSAEKYLDLFCEKSNTEKQHIRKWIPIVAASQSVDGNSRAREFLLSRVDAMESEN